MRYVNARYEELKRGEAYRIYVTDSLNLQGQNKYLSMRYYDMINPKPNDERTGDEIALEVIKKAGIKMG